MVSSSSSSFLLRILAVDLDQFDGVPPVSKALAYLTHRAVPFGPELLAREQPMQHDSRRRSFFGTFLGGLVSARVSFPSPLRTHAPQSARVADVSVQQEAEEREADGAMV